MITARELCVEARTWVGTKYRHQGRTRNGVDCGGFIEVILRGFDLLPDHYRAPRAYRRTPSSELLRVTASYLEPAPKVEAGLLVLIRWPMEKEPSHMAFCTGENLIHSYRKQVVEHGYRGIWVRDTHSLWRVPGVSYE